MSSAIANSIFPTRSCGFGLEYSISKSETDMDWTPIESTVC